MGERKEPVRATATIIGALDKPAALDWCQAQRQSIARANIGGIPVTAHGEWATFLNGCKPNTRLRVEADLSMHQWKTGEGKPRDQLTLVATRIEEANA